MENRYQKFLRETLWVGLQELRANPAASEVAGIPIEAFDILVRAFRSGLSEELKITLLHDLANPEYLRAVLAKIDILLSPGIPETVTLSNSSNIHELIFAYDEAQKLKESVIANQQGWQAKSAKQFEEYNRRLILGLQKQLEKDLPSLPPEKRDVLVRDLARTIGDHAFPGIELSWQTKDKLRETTELTLKTYASEVEELRKPEFVSQIAQRVAQEQETATWETRSAQIQATTFPATYRVDSSLRAAIIANLPPETYQRNPKVVEEISRQVLSRLSLPALAQQPTFEDYQRELTSEIRTILSSSSFRRLLPAEQQAEISSVISSQIGQVAQNYSISPEATMAGGLPAQAPTTPTVSIGGVGPGKEDFLTSVYLSSGQPLFFFTSLTSPQAGENLLRWAGTGGPVRSLVGFIADSVPGNLKLGVVADLFGPYRQSIKQHYQTLPYKPGLSGFEKEKAIQESKAALRLLEEFDKYKGPRVEAAFGFYRRLWTIRHPLLAFRQTLLSKSLTAGMTADFLIGSIGAYLKYGGYGGAYVTEQYLKHFAVFLFKVAGAKVGLYQVVGPPLHRKYVFVPTYKLKLKIQEAIYKRIPRGLKNFLAKLAAKLGISVSALLGGVGIAISILGFLWKPLKELSKYLLALLAMLIAKYGMPALIGAITGGLAGLFGGGFLGFKLGVAIGTAIAPGIGTVVGGIVGTVLGGFIGFFAGAFAGTGLGILWVNLTGGGIPAIGGLGGGIGAVPSLAPYATPTLLLAGATVLPAAVFTLIVISEPFRGVGEEISYGSKFIQISKGYSVASFQNKDRLPNSVAENSETITYQIKVNVSQPTQPLTDIVVTDKLIVTNAAGSQSFDLGTWDKNTDPQLAQMGAGDSWEKTYTFGLNPGFVDSVFSNTVTVKSAEGETQTGTLSFAIGNPPVETPLGWPVASGCITQGPGGYYSHRGYEAIDIGSSEVPILGDPVFATHNGAVTRAVDDQGTATTGYGNHVIITGVGLNGPFETRYAHLQIVSVLYGDKVNRGEQIGTVGDSGKSDGPHLHYEFRNLKMEPPYIPISVPACSGEGPISCPRICW